MYYLKTVSDKVCVPPNLLASDLEDAVLRMLRDKFERRIFRDLGVVLVVNDVDVEGDGVVIPGDSGVYYEVKFEVLTFMPQINEVFEAEVKELVDFGAFSSIGPLQGLLHVSQIGSDKFFFDKKSKTLNSRAAKRTIKKGDALLVKVSTVSLKGALNDTKIGLTMRPNGLGKAEWMEEKKPKPAEKKADKKKGEDK